MQTAEPLRPTNGPLPSWGVALARIGVAIFKVRVARATPNVYKSPPLHLGDQFHLSTPNRTGDIG